VDKASRELNGRMGALSRLRWRTRKLKWTEGREQSISQRGRGDTGVEESSRSSHDVDEAVANQRSDNYPTMAPRSAEEAFPGTTLGFGFIFDLPYLWAIQEPYSAVY